MLITNLYYPRTNSNIGTKPLVIQNTIRTVMESLENNPRGDLVYTFYTPPLPASCDPCVNGSSYGLVEGGSAKPVSSPTLVQIPSNSFIEASDEGFTMNNSDLELPKQVSSFLEQHRSRRPQKVVVLYDSGVQTYYILFADGRMEKVFAENVVVQDDENVFTMNNSDFSLPKQVSYFLEEHKARQPQRVVVLYDAGVQTYFIIFADGRMEKVFAENVLVDENEPRIITNYGIGDKDAYLISDDNGRKMKVFAENVHFLPRIYPNNRIGGEDAYMISDDKGRKIKVFAENVHFLPKENKPRIYPNNGNVDKDAYLISDDNGRKTKVFAENVVKENEPRILTNYGMEGRHGFPIPAENGPKTKGPTGLWITNPHPNDFLYYFPGPKKPNLEQPTMQAPSGPLPSEVEQYTVDHIPVVPCRIPSVSSPIEITYINKHSSCKQNPKAPVDNRPKVHKAGPMTTNCNTIPVVPSPSIAPHSRMFPKGTYRVKEIDLEECQGQTFVKPKPKEPIVYYGKFL